MKKTIKPPNRNSFGSISGSRRGGLKAAETRRLIKQENMSKAIKLLEQGYSIKQIAEILRLTPQTIRVYFREYVNKFRQEQEKKGRENER